MHRSGMSRVRDPLSNIRTLESFCHKRTEKFLVWFRPDLVFTVDRGWHHLFPFLAAGFDESHVETVVLDGETCSCGRDSLVNWSVRSGSRGMQGFSRPNSMIPVILHRCSRKRRFAVAVVVGSVSRGRVASGYFGLIYSKYNADTDALWS
ncbi:hypothetical protein SUGI_0750290 [Cryptomeria japonica]|nr:hypothetical protein SUGI_0750290 [Cryptomeria japonica]